MSHLFSVLAGLALAFLTWEMDPRFLKFSALAYRLAMSEAAFACGCSLSAVMYWWANRSPGVRPAVLQGALVGFYGAVVIIAAVVSTNPDLWHDSVDASCLVRGGLMIGAVRALDRRQYAEAHA